MLFNKEKTGFFKWIGLYKPKNSKWLIKAILILIVSVIIMGGPIFIFETFNIIPKGMIYSLNASGKGFTAEIIAIVLIKAIFQNALSEEVFFRGFIGKRLANKFGYLSGNLIQAILFGLPHGLAFIIAYKAYVFGIVLFLTATTVGFLQFYINEKKANGSIFPSLIIHSIMNIVSNI
jgi:CAAX amino terminal protease family.